MIEARTVKPIKEWALVLAEPRKPVTSGGIILTGELTAPERVEGGAGRLIYIGTDEKFRTVDLSQGTRILYRGFLKYANPVDSEETWPDGQKKHFFLMKLDDIIAEIGDDVEVGAFSTSPKERANASQ